MSETIGILGVGFLGRGIAASLLAHEFNVIALDPRAGPDLESDIEDALRELLVHGEVDALTLHDWRGRFHLAKSMNEFSDCDFVIESVSEDIDIKRAVFTQLEKVICPDIPMTSNTSSIPISLMQKWLKHPQRFAGMHWAGPAHIFRFMEVIRGEQTDDATLAAVIDLGKRAGKDPAVIQRDIAGFIVNRLTYAMLREAFYLLESGIGDIESIDKCFRNVVGAWSTIAGPFRWIDLTGCALYANGMRQIFPTLCNSTDVPKTMLEMESAGAMGVKNQHGFYEYTQADVQKWDQLLREQLWRAREMQEKL